MVDNQESRARRMLRRLMQNLIKSTRAFDQILITFGMSRIWLRHARALRWTVATPGAIASESKDGFPGWTEAAFRLPADGGGCGLPRAARCRTPGEKEVAEGVRFCLLLPAILVYRYTGILVKRGVAVFLNKFRGGFLSILNRRRENGRISGRQTGTEGVRGGMATQ